MMMIYYNAAAHISMPYVRDVDRLGNFGRSGNSALVVDGRLLFSKDKCSRDS